MNATTTVRSGAGDNRSSVSVRSERPAAQSRVRANIRVGSRPEVIRERYRSRAVIYAPSRTRIVTTTDSRPSYVTVIKKKKYAKKKKKIRIYATAPSSSTTIIERRRPGAVVVGGGVIRTRTVSRPASSVRIGVRTSNRTTIRAGIRGSGGGSTTRMLGTEGRSTTGAAPRSEGSGGAAIRSERSRGSANPPATTGRSAPQ